LPAPQVSFNQQGIYPVTLTYITESGCTRTTSYEARVYGKPAANFSYNIPCGNSLNLQFSDNSYFSDGWNWTFGDGGSDYGLASPRHNYNDTGKYNVTFISRIGHCADTIVKPVYANILPSSINIIKAETTCAGTRGTVTFDHRSLRASGGTWSFGDGTIISYDTGAHNITHTYTATGTYNVLLTSFYGNCTLTSNRTVHVLLKQAPTLTTSNNTIICSNNQLNIQVANLVTNPYSGSYSWGQYNITNFQSTNGTPVSSSLTNATWQYTVYTATMQNFARAFTA
jgi:PKD repeat protein